MTTEEIIARIKAINQSADQEFLEGFSQDVLESYLKRLVAMAKKGVPAGAGT